MPGFSLPRKKSPDMMVEAARLVIIFGVIFLTVYGLQIAFTPVCAPAHIARAR